MTRLSSSLPALAATVLRAATLAAGLLILPVACQDGAVTAVVGGSGPLRVSADSYDGRVDAALAKVSGTQISKGGGEKLAELGGIVLSDAPGALVGVPDGVVVQPLMDDPALREALMGHDEKAVVDLLVAKGVKGLLIHGRIHPSVDRDRRIYSRLVHHDYLDLLRLYRVGDGILYYSVNEAPVLFPPQLAALCIRYLQARLAGKRVEGMPELESDTGEWTFVGTIRGQGQELAMAFARDGNLARALDELAQDIEVEHRRRKELLGFPRLSEHVEDLSIEIQRVTERAYVEPRGEDFLEELMEMGVDGAFVMTADKKERGMLPGSVAYTRNLTTADRFLREAADQGRMSERRPWRDDDAWLEIFRTVHFRNQPDAGLVFLYRGVPAVGTSAVTLASTREAILSAGDWWIANMDPEGRLNYKFWPHENRFSADYNLVRHTLATWNLVQAWRVDPEQAPIYLEGAKRALDYTNRYLVDETIPEGKPNAGQVMSYYSYNNNQKLGTVVVNLMGIIDYARATGTTEYDDLIRRLARFALFMQKESGTFDGYHVERGHPYFGQTNDIVPGEAALALVMVAEYLDEDVWIETLPAFFSFYEPWFAERVGRRHQDRAWPRYIYDNDDRLELVQFGPWTVMAANAYHARTGDERVGAFGLEIARWMIEAYMYDGDRSPFPDYIGGYFKMPTELPAMQAFCYAEGTAAAYALALRMGREEDARFFDLRTRETIRFGMVMQYDDLDTYAFTRPELLWGGIRYAMNEVKVRIDYTYHGQSAFVQWYEAALNDPNLPEDVRNGPMGRPRPRKVLAAAGRPVPGSGMPVATASGEADTEADDAESGE